MAEKIRSVGLKQLLMGDVAASGMPTTMLQPARVFKGSAAFTTEADTDSEFYCEEDIGAPVEIVPSAAGLKQLKGNFMEWTPDMLVQLFGGTKTTADVTVNAVVYTVEKYSAPRDIVIIEQAVRAITLYDAVIDIPRARVMAQFAWNLDRTAIAQVAVTCKVLLPSDTDDSPYYIYKLGEPKAAG